MQTSKDFHAEAEQFRARAGTTDAEKSRTILLHLSQAWETLAEAWDGLKASDSETAH
ncbi:MAG TPA: hypothetical protein VHT51_18900 [Micropepsaceae bacterium]|jgi:hypothetical protein|nr:hypothetical protein [Micropepsaceae bacterium]